MRFRFIKLPTILDFIINWANRYIFIYIFHDLFMGRIKANKIFKSIISILIIIFLLILISYFLGYDVREKIDNIKDNFTKEEIKINFSCQEAENRYTETYGEWFERPLKSHYKLKCRENCKVQGEDIDPYNADLVSCEKEILTCICHKN